MKNYNCPPNELLKDYTNNSFDYASKENKMFGVPWRAYPQVGLKTVMQSERLTIQNKVHLFLH